MMGFPIQYPIFQFLYWLVNTTSVGGVFVGILVTGMLLAYIRTLGWIRGRERSGEPEGLPYPPAVHPDQSG